MNLEEVYPAVNFGILVQKKRIDMIEKDDIVVEYNEQLNCYRLKYKPNGFNAKANCMFFRKPPMQLIKTYDSYDDAVLDIPEFLKQVNIEKGPENDWVVVEPEEKEEKNG